VLQTKAGGPASPQALRELMLRKAEKLSRGKQLRVGFLEGATAGRKGASAAQVAFINEFGAPAAGIPPRPFFRVMIRLNQKGWARIMAAGLKKDGDPATAMALLGEKIRSQLQRSIGGWSSPPNTDEVAKRKHKNTPLKDTKNMMNAVDYEVS